MATVTATTRQPSFHCSSIVNSRILPQQQLDQHQPFLSVIYSLDNYPIREVLITCCCPQLAAMLTTFVSTSSTSSAAYCSAPANCSAKALSKISAFPRSCRPLRTAHRLVVRQSWTDEFVVLHSNIGWAILLASAAAYIARILQAQSGGFPASDTRAVIT